MINSYFYNKIHGLKVKPEFIIFDNEGGKYLFSNVCLKITYEGREAGEKSIFYEQVFGLCCDLNGISEKTAKIFLPIIKEILNGK